MLVWRANSSARKHSFSYLPPYISSHSTVVSLLRRMSCPGLGIALLPSILGWKSVFFTMSSSSSLLIGAAAPKSLLYVSSCVCLWVASQFLSLFSSGCISLTFELIEIGGFPVLSVSIKPGAEGAAGPKFVFLTLDGLFSLGTSLRDCLTGCFC